MKNRRPAFYSKRPVGWPDQKQRYVLQAELFEGKDGTEIAQLLHIKKAAVSRIRARALRHLQELLAAGRQRGERLC